MGEGRTFTAADAITVARAGLGVLAIFVVLYYPPLSAVPLILLTVVLDGLDGEVARRLGAEHRMGHVLDGIADLFCFCIAPSVLFYLLATDGSLPSAPDDPYLLPFFVCAGILGVGAIRLAMFVRDHDGGPHFKGLPTAALALLGISLLHPQLAEYVPYEFTFILLGLLIPLELTGIPFPKLTRVQGLVAMVFILLVMVDTSLHLMGIETHMGLPAVAALLVNIGTYIFAGPPYMYRKLGRGAGEERGAGDGYGRGGESRAKGPGGGKGAP